MMKFDYAILAADKQGGIGLGNKLLFVDKKDTEFFQKMTTEVIVVMGSNTYKSLPNGGQFLPRRGCAGIVLTREPEKLEVAPGFVCVTEENFLSAVSLIKTSHERMGTPLDKVVLIGGGYYYNRMDEFEIEKVYLTIFNSKDENYVSRADTFVDLNQKVFSKSVIHENHENITIYECQPPEI